MQNIYPFEAIFRLRGLAAYAILRQDGRAARPLLAATPPTVNTNRRDRLVGAKREKERKFMTEQTLEALEYSIAHWERLASGERYDGEGIGPAYCALCNMFYNTTKTQVLACVGCPVLTHTGQRYCNDTPYHAAELAWGDGGCDSSKFLHAAKAELEFLKSLRETPRDE